MSNSNLFLIISVLLTLTHLLGIYSAIDALYWVKSSQAAIAWGISLVIFPYAALPTYWILGRRRFKGYRELLKSMVRSNKKEIEHYGDIMRPYRITSSAGESEVTSTLEKVLGKNFYGGNQVKLLIDGEVFFKALHEAIDSAQKYLLIQFYTIRDDTLGEEFKSQLIKRAAEGIKIRILYDEIGSLELSDNFIDQMKAANIEVQPFETRRGFGNCFQINFRNHRKCLIVDGQRAFIGGFNLGDEYLGKSKFGEWRDTGLELLGPAVLEIQAVYYSDWVWATQKNVELDWKIATTPTQSKVLILPSGPADEYERCLFFFVEMINAAKNRVWISTPYFIPDSAIVAAINMAALRGVDVGIIIPKKVDHWLAWMASFSYVAEITWSAAKVYRYKKGFLHQKVILIDDQIAAVGTANLDSRSLNLNFELMAIVADSDFNRQVALMFEVDFGHAELEDYRNIAELPLWRRLGSRLARLFSPIL